MKITKNKVNLALEYIKAHSGEQITIADISSHIAAPHSYARHLLDVLVKQRRIDKVPLKATHKYYVRYTYVVREDDNGTKQ
jgi:DNA-binding IclR family transcriptional regulator